MPFTRGTVPLEGALAQHVLVTTTVRERLVEQGAEPPEAVIVRAKATGNGFVVPFTGRLTVPLTVPLTILALMHVMTALVLLATTQQYNGHA